MAQVEQGEPELRRVIDEDREVDGLGEQELLELVCDYPMPLHVDGEDLGDVEGAVFEAERGAVSVFV